MLLVHHGQIDSHKRDHAFISMPISTPEDVEQVCVRDDGGVELNHNRLAVVAREVVVWTCLETV